MKHAVGITLGLLAAAFLAAALFLYSAAKNFSFGEDYSLDASSFDAKAMEMVSKPSGLKLPPNTKGLNMFYQGSGIDDAFAAKIQVPTENVPEITGQLSAITENPVTTSISFPEAAAWWKPDLLKTKIERRFEPSAGTHTTVFFGESDGQWYLFVEWFSI